MCNNLAQDPLAYMYAGLAKVSIVVRFINFNSVLHLIILESLSTEKRQLFKVEADLKVKITNLFNGIYFSHMFLIDHLEFCRTLRELIKGEVFIMDANPTFNVSICLFLSSLLW